MTNRQKKRIKNWKIHPSQRGTFAYELYKAMCNNKNIVLLTGDLGFGMLDNIIEDFPDRAISVGASEQSMVGIAVGLAQEGKLPFIYTITSFFMRGAETIGLYLHSEQTKVIMVGSGRGDDYKDDGISHDATIAQDYIKSLKIKSYFPEDKKEISGILHKVVKLEHPAFISLRR